MGKKYLETKKNTLESSILGVWKTAIEEGDARMDGRTKQYREHRKKLESRRVRKEEVELDEATGKEIAAKMMKDKSMKAFASKVAKMKTVSRDDLEKMLPDYVAGAAITKLFEEVELDEGKAKYTRKLMKNKSIVDYVKKQQEKNRKDVAKFGNKKVGASGNEPRFDSGSGWLDMASDEVKQNRMSDDKRRAFDADAEYEAIARKLGLHKFEPKLEEVELDESEFDAMAYGKKDQRFVVKPRDTRGMAGKQDKFKMYVVKIDNRGNEIKVIKDLGSHSSIAGAKKFAANRGIIKEKTILERIDRKLKERKNG